MIEVIEAQTNPGASTNPNTEKSAFDLKTKSPDQPIDPYTDETTANEPETQQMAPDDTSEPAADADDGNEVDTDDNSDNSDNSEPSKLPWILGAVAATGLVVWWVRRKSKQRQQVQGWTPPRLR